MGRATVSASSFRLSNPWNTGRVPRVDTRGRAGRVRPFAFAAGHLFGDRIVHLSRVVALG